MIKLESISKALLILLAIVFLAMGLQGLFTPDAFFGQLGLVLTTPSARSEMRTAYGGMFGGVAFLFLRAAWSEDLARPAFSLAATICGIFVLVRGYSMLVDGMPNTISMVYLGLELFGFFVAIGMARWLR